MSLLAIVLVIVLAVLFLDVVQLDAGLRRILGIVVVVVLLVVMLRLLGAL